MSSFSRGLTTLGFHAATHANEVTEASVTQVLIRTGRDTNNSMIHTIDTSSLASPCLMRRAQAWNPLADSVRAQQPGEARVRLGPRVSSAAGRRHPGSWHRRPQCCSAITSQRQPVWVDGVWVSNTKRHLKLMLTLSIPSSKSTFSQPFQEKCISEVVRTGTRIIFQSE